MGRLAHYADVHSLTREVPEYVLAKGDTRGPVVPQSSQRSPSSPRYVENR